jgi:hypothetical protein
MVGSNPYPARKPDAMAFMLAIQAAQLLETLVPDFGGRFDAIELSRSSELDYLF